MKIYHRIQAYFLRRKLIRQRAANIAQIREGRVVVRDVRRELVRHQRLAFVAKPGGFALGLTMVARSAAKSSGDSGPRLVTALAGVPRPVRRVA